MAIRAGRLFIQKIAERIERKESFIVESTLSGLSLGKWISRARDAGYHVAILFVFLDSADICIQRVAARVTKGGHHVPDEDVTRRWTRSNQNFWSTYRTLANEWSLFNNGDEGIVQIAASGDENMVILDEGRFEKWQEMLKV